MNYSKKLISLLKVLFDNRQRNFYFFLALPLISILFTHPFLRYPYDMFHHLIQIDKYYEATEIPQGRELWHFLWAKFFYFFSIPNNEVFFRAKVIHILQTYIAFFSVFFFTKVMIRNIFKQINTTILNYLSLWSVIIWFTIFATFSVHYQQVWNMWYSVNYQITLPLFWYITALTLILFWEEVSLGKKIFFIIQILLISRFILQVHSMEFLYYLMYLLVFGIIYLDKIYYLFKKYFYIMIPLIFPIIYFARKYQPEKSKFFNYLEIDKLPLFYHDIITQGQLIVSGGFNRVNASINELMIVILYLAVLLIILIIIRTKLLNKASFIDFKAFIFLIITSMFVLIPVFELSAGLFAIITHTMIVNRLYYSSSLFLILPVFVYYILYIKDKKNINIIKMNLSLIFILSSVYFYSKYYSSNHTYYKNVQSIKNSFFERNVGFNLSPQQIELIGKIIKVYEKEYKTNKKIYYYARPDIAFVIKYVYRKNVLWKDRRANLNYIELYNEAIIYDKIPRWKYPQKIKNNNKFYLILFEIPEDFPEFQPYK